MIVSGDGGKRATGTDRGGHRHGRGEKQRKYVYPGGLESCSVLPNDMRCVNLLCNPYASRLT